MISHRLFAVPSSSQRGEFIMRKKKKVSTRKVDILRTIKPYDLYLIFTFKKRAIVGKSKPNAENWSNKVFLYCSKDKKSFKRIPLQDQEWMQQYLGKVACMVHIDRIDDYQNCFISDVKNASDELTIKPLLEASQLTLEELRDYTYNQGPFDCIYAWYVNGIVQHGYPQDLLQFRNACDKRKCVGCEFYNSEKANACEHTSYAITCINVVTRPPQNYCYIMGD